MCDPHLVTYGAMIHFLTLSLLGSAACQCDDHFFASLDIAANGIYIICTTILSPLPVCWSRMLHKL